jgi:hypothetical protein
MTLLPYLRSWSKKKHVLVSSKPCAIILTRENCRKYITVEIQMHKYFLKGGSQEVNMLQRTLMVLKKIYFLKLNIKIATDKM